MKRKSVQFLVRAAIIAAVYAALTILFAPISYGLVQVRVSEALCILPFFTVAAVPGLFIGCLIANLVAGLGILDIVFGSLATLVAAYITSKIKNKWLAPLPAVLVNAVVIGAMLYYLQIAPLPIWMFMIYVGVGQTVACYGIGMPLLFLLKKYRIKLFT